MKFQIPRYKGFKVGIFRISPISNLTLFQQKSHCCRFVLHGNIHLIKADYLSSNYAVGCFYEQTVTFAANCGKTYDNGKMDEDNINWGYESVSLSSIRQTRLSIIQYVGISRIS